MIACRRSARPQQLPRVQQLGRPCAVSHRAFSTTPARRADDKAGKEKDDADAEAYQKLDLKTMNKAFAETATPEACGSWTSWPRATATAPSTNS